jgi:hypothetical protein
MRGKAAGLLSGLLSIWLVGCGSSALQPAQAPQVSAASQAQDLAASGRVPTNFTVVMGVVIKLLPADNHGLPHQKFVIQEIEPRAGRILEVAHNTSMAPPVEDLRKGDRVIIRGVLFSGVRNGIHWTHHAKRPGDAGFIKTEDGRIYD